MEHKVTFDDGSLFLRVIPDGDTAEIHVYDGEDLAVDSYDWDAAALRGMAFGLLKIARYINPPEADQKRLEDEAKADLEMMLKRIEVE